MPLILNIDTATEICSVCISKNKKIIAIEETDQKYAHSKVITKLIQTCCSIANLQLKNLDAVAISEGPGSYTGLRVGTSTAKGICYALNKPLITINTLTSLAYGAAQLEKKEAFYCPMIDARRMEVYTALYNSKMERIQETNAMILDENSFHSFFKEGKQIVFCGDGAAKFQKIINNPLAIFSPILNSSKLLVALANQKYQLNKISDMAYFSPNYFKAPNITQPKKVL